MSAQVLLNKLFEKKLGMSEEKEAIKENHIIWQINYKYIYGLCNIVTDP